MKKYTKPLKILSVILLFVVIGFLIFSKSENNQNKIGQVQDQETTLTIKASANYSPINISGFIGKTVLEATEASVKEVKTEGSGINAYVVSIEGRVADSKKNEFWELAINGKPSEVGAGSHIIKAGDKIIWQINTF